MLWTSPGDKNISPKRSKLPAQDFQKVPQRSLGALRSAPGEPQEAPESSPRELSGDLWASKKTPGVVLAVSEPHFGTPGASFICFSNFSKPFLLSSLLFSFSLFSYMLFFTLSFLISFLVSLLSARVSLRASLRSIQRRGGFRVANWDPPRRSAV